MPNNRDNPCGFEFVRSLDGEAVILSAEAGVDLLKGDAVHMESAVLQVAVNTDTKIYGIMAADADCGDQGMFYPAVPEYVFEVQSSHTVPFVAATHTNFACELAGGTGVMELHLVVGGGTMQFIVYRLADTKVEAVPNIVGANARVYCTIYQSQFLGIPGVTQVHA